MMVGWDYFRSYFDSPKQRAIQGLCVLFSLFILASVTVWMISSFKQKVVFLFFALVLTFLLKPLAGSTGRPRSCQALDILLVLLGVGASTYLFANDLALVYRVGAATVWDKIVAGIVVMLVLEATRRVTGWPLVIISLAFIIYAFYGEYLPGSLGHSGMSLERLLSELSLTENGIFGVAVRTMIWFVFLFIIFGAFLEQAGTVRFFEDFSKAVAGRSVGGPGKVSVVASCLMGMISGSAVANVVTTGAFTIPSMKRFGFKPNEFPAAVEAAASTGGQLMPPIMGATAFVMADFIGVPYLEVVKAALVPALLYYLSVGIAVHYQALRLGLVGVGEREVPPAKVLTKTYLFIPVIVLTVAMVAGYSATFAALFGLATAIVVGAFDRETRINIIRAMAALERAARSSLSICAPVACAGIIAGITLSTGLGLKISSLVLHYSGGNTIILLVLSAIACFIFGMGLPSVVCYILLATLLGPAIVNCGIQPLLGHLFLFYFGMLAMITPPVAFAAYAGAAIAGGDPMKTGWWAVRLTLPSFLIPFIWIYSPALAGQATLPFVIYTFVTAAIGVIAIEASLLNPKESVLMRLVTIAGGVLLIMPDHITNIIGAVLVGVIWLVKRRIGKAMTMTESGVGERRFRDARHS